MVRHRSSLVVAFVVASALLASVAAPSASGAGAGAGAGERSHRIGIRERNGSLELVDLRTGGPFVPRGANLLMLVREGDHVASGLFRPRDWNRAAVDRKLARMQTLGYNTVRVFIDLCNVDCIATKRASIRPAYGRNIARFLRIAKSHGLVVLLASNDLPDRGYGAQLPCCDPFGGYRNSLWLTAKGHALLRQYWVDVIRALKRANAPLGAVFAYEIQQEQFLLRGVAPLSFDSGMITTADGRTYDMSDDAQKDSMIASNTRLAVRKVRSAIRASDPGALVTMGFFPGFAEDFRVVPSAAMLHRSALDLFDLHLYPAVGYDLQTGVDTLGLTDGVIKPVVMGEFGAFRFAYPDADAGSEALVQWQAGSCAFGFDGWMVWLWARSDDEVFGARESHDTIAQALSPTRRPDPCASP
jgi:hypothetical protein